MRKPEANLATDNPPLPEDTTILTSRYLNLEESDENLNSDGKLPDLYTEQRNQNDTIDFHYLSRSGFDEK